ncbi:MarR family transcriptional regulator [Corallococcus sp. H22C18031201]|nr:MarR family transcriptional regulator [Corallococcus sp. H22C18031201]
MAGNTTTGRAALASEVWRHVFDFFMHTRPRRDAVLRDLGLTPNDARALSGLDVARGRSMRQLAEGWDCDASNVTWMVGRLEKRGLARRQTDPEDRRARSVVLTARGARVRRQLEEGMHAPPAELSHLEMDELEHLRGVFERLAAEAAKTAEATSRGGR